MPFADRKARREWETSPAQQEATAERQEALRERREHLHRLAAVLKIHDRCGHWRFCGPVLRAQVEARRDDIRELIEAQNREKVVVTISPKV